jgi:hypothetical protein
MAIAIPLFVVFMAERSLLLGTIGAKDGSRGSRVARKFRAGSSRRTPKGKHRRGDE